jgi:predicted PurR-regulated permease PerM
MMGREKLRYYLFFISIFSLLAFGVLFPRLSLPFGLAYIIYAMVKPLTTFLEKKEGNWIVIDGKPIPYKVGSENIDL